MHERAVVAGEVVVGPESSIWPGAILRGDVGPITVGSRTSVQDCCVIHTTGGKSVAVVGDRVTVGHSAILHGCEVADDCIIGMGALVMDNAVIDRWSVVAAGALVPPGKRYPPGVLILGRPGKVARELTEAERRWVAESAEHYVELALRWARG